jgi:hypothetical protein
MRQFQILISPAGEVRLETHGFGDSSCRDASRALERALGLVLSDQPRTEFCPSPEPIRESCR